MTSSEPMALALLSVSHHRSFAASSLYRRFTTVHPQRCANNPSIAICVVDRTDGPHARSSYFPLTHYTSEIPRLEMEFGCCDVPLGRGAFIPKKMCAALVFQRAVASIILGRGTLEGRGSTGKLAAFPAHLSPRGLAPPYYI